MAVTACTNRRRLHWLVILTFLCSTARADVILTAENLNDSLKELQRLQRRLNGDAVDSAQKARTLLAIGRQADALTQRFSDEVTAHGNEQQGLIDFGLRRLGNLGVQIEWSESHGTFWYDGTHYRQYLELLPAGAGAEQSIYRLIYISFFSTETTSREELAAAAERKREFLERFPESGHGAEVAFLLGIDYRDIWRRCREAGDSRCSGDYEARTRQQLRQVFEAWPGTRHAALAQRLLVRFEEEVAGSG